MSHPVWVRGLKLGGVDVGGQAARSHPVWVRGLKRFVNKFMANGQYVAPRVGAWIETAFEKNTSSIRKSHPVWVRGLKQFHLFFSFFSDVSHPVWVRGLKLYRF